MNQEHQIENVKRKVAIQKLMIEQQRMCVASAKDVADKEYQKLKQLEKDLLELLDEEVELEQEQRDEQRRFKRKD